MRKIRQALSYIFIKKTVPIDWLRQKIREQVEAYKKRMNE